MFKAGICFRQKFHNTVKNPETAPKVIVNIFWFRHISNLAGTRSFISLLYYLRPHEEIFIYARIPLKTNFVFTGFTVKRKYLRLTRYARHTVKCKVRRNDKTLKEKSNLGIFVKIMKIFHLMQRFFTDTFRFCMFYVLF